jgi:hypothetical protein
MTMSQDAGESPVKPTVIDLDAEDVVASDEPPPPASEHPPKHTSPLWWIAAVLALGLIGGGWLYKDVLSAYFPSNGLNDAIARIATLEQQTRTIADQSAAAAAKAQGDVEAIGQSVGEAKTQNAELVQRISQLEAGLAGLGNDVKALKSEPQSAAGGPDIAAIAPLVQRIEALEREVARLKSAPPLPSEPTRPQVLMQSLSDLKAKIAAGAGYTDELTRLQRLVPAAAGLDRLTAHADRGLPTADGLADELNAIAATLPKPAAEAADDGGYLSGFWKAMSGIVIVRRMGEADWPALAARAADLVRKRELQKAVDLLDNAKGEKPQALLEWRSRAAGRIEMDAALAEASDAVARQLASMGGAP